MLALQQWLHGLLSVQIRNRLHRLARPAFMGTLRRTSPLSNNWGFDRGRPVDRFYIERFLAEHQRDITGRVLEVQSPAYTEMFGVAPIQSDILDIDPSNALASRVADLASADQLPSDVFQCFILTQTLHLIHDTRAAIHHAHRMLKPGGVLLVTVPAVSRIDPESKADQWRFTAAACTRLFEEAFGAGYVSVHSYGNVLACIAFLTGMAAEELSARELEHNDEAFPLVIAVRAVKAD